MASDAQRKANAKYLASKKTLTIRIDHDEADEISMQLKKPVRVYRHIFYKLFGID